MSWNCVSRLDRRAGTISPSGDIEQQSLSIPAAPIAIRVYPVPSGTPSRRDRKYRRLPLPDAWLVWDTETHIDLTQRLLFGNYRFIEDGTCLTERLFCGDDLTEAERAVLTAYVGTHRADVGDGGREELSLLSRAEFLQSFFRLAYKARVLIVGFNQPFDLSRVAYDQATSRGKFGGGFSLGLWSYRDQNGRERRHQQRPRIGIKHIDSKRALIGFTSRKGIDEEDLIPEDSETGLPEEGYKFRGHFLDLRTLALPDVVASVILTGRVPQIVDAFRIEATGVLKGLRPVRLRGTIQVDPSQQDFFKIVIEAQAAGETV